MRSDHFEAIIVAAQRFTSRERRRSGTGCAAVLFGIAVAEEAEEEDVIQRRQRRRRSA